LTFPPKPQEGEKANVKKSLYILAGLAAMGGLGWFGAWVSAQPGGVQPAAATAKPVTKIGVMNIAKVLKNFNNANYLGDTLIQEAQQHENTLKTMQLDLQKEEMRITALPNGAEKDNAMKKVRADKAAIEEKQFDFRKKLSERQQEMAGTVMKAVDHIVDFLAKQNGLELVLQYPDATTDEEAKSPASAIRRLSAPAAMVAWKVPGLDISEEVIRYLNHYYPAPANYKPSTATGPSIVNPPAAPANTQPATNNPGR
jgi:Skp family chaperone for outer membrane proteins